eukprot:scaffold194661_cov17-Prasinocladus_malaysianus.AAC.1
MRQQPDWERGEREYNVRSDSLAAMDNEREEVKELTQQRLNGQLCQSNQSEKASFGNKTPSTMPP